MIFLYLYGSYSAELFIFFHFYRPDGLHVMCFIAHISKIVSLLFSRRQIF